MKKLKSVQLFVFVYALAVGLIVLATGMDLDGSIQLILTILVVSGGVSLAIAMPILVLYLPPILHKKTKLEMAKEIMEQNIQVVEEATFFKSNTKFQDIIDKQIESIKANMLEIKKQKAIMDELEDDIIRAKEEKEDTEKKKKGSSKKK